MPLNSLGKMPLQMLSRRPSNPVIIAITGTLLFLLLLFQVSRTSVPAQAVEKASSFLKRPTATTSGTLVDDVFNATFGFQKIFVVSMPGRTDRRDAIVLSAALSGLEVEFIDGPRGSEVEDNAITMNEGSGRQDEGQTGAWRGHMNAVSAAVHQNLQTVLIMEDDTDWDVRIREQLHDFAKSAHGLVKDGTFLPSSDLEFDSLPSIPPPTFSPYGDEWEALWLGHCGMRFPSSTQPASEKIPRGRVMRIDETVPEKHYLRQNGRNDLEEQYQNHTRVVHYVSEGICTTAYALTQKGARNFLRTGGLHDSAMTVDMLLRQYCQMERGKTFHACLTVQPALFQQHHREGAKKADSNIADGGDEYRKKGVTDVVRWSLRMNWDTLLDGDTKFVDQYPDTYDPGMERR